MMRGSKLSGLIANGLRLAVLVVVVASAAWVANRADIVDVPIMDRVELPFLGSDEDEAAVEPQQGMAPIELVAVSYLDNGRTMFSVASEEPIPEGEFVGIVNAGGEQLEFSCEQLPEYPDRLYCSGLGAGPETQVEFQLGFKASKPTLAQRLQQTGQLPAMQYALSAAGLGVTAGQAVAAGSNPIDLEGPAVGFDEPIIEFEDPIVEFEDPIVEFEDPIVEFEDPIVEFEDPIVEYDDPVIAFESPASVLDPANSFRVQVQQVALGQRTAEMAFDPSQGIWGTTGTLQPLEEAINQRFDAIESCLADYDPSLSEASVQSTEDAYNGLLYVAAVDQASGRDPLANCAVAGEIQAVQLGAIAETACYLSGSPDCADPGLQTFASNREIFQAIRSDEAVCWYALGLEGEFEDPSQLAELAAAVEEATDAGEDLPEVCQDFLQGDGFAVGVESFSLFVAETELPPDWYEDFHDRFGGFGDLNRPDGLGSSEESNESSAYDSQPPELYQLCGQSLGRQTSWSAFGAQELVSMMNYRLAQEGALTEECQSMVEQAGSDGSSLPPALDIGRRLPSGGELRLPLNPFRGQDQCTIDCLFAQLNGDSCDCEPSGGSLPELNEDESSEMAEGMAACAAALDRDVPSNSEEYRELVSTIWSAAHDGDDVPESCATFFDNTQDAFRSEEDEGEGFPDPGSSRECTTQRILLQSTTNCSSVDFNFWPDQNARDGLEQAIQCSIDLSRPEPISYVDFYELGIRVNRAQAAGEEVSSVCQTVQEYVNVTGDLFDFGLDLHACAARRNACMTGAYVRIGDKVLKGSVPTESCGSCADFGQEEAGIFTRLANACAADFGWYGGEMNNAAEEMSLLRHVTGLAGLIPSKHMPETCRTYMEFYANLSRADGFSGLIEASLQGGLERISPAEGLWSESISFVTPPSGGTAEEEGPRNIEATDIPEVITCPPGQIFNDELGECEIIN